MKNIGWKQFKIKKNGGTVFSDFKAEIIISLSVNLFRAIRVGSLWT
jgi:hypothetical protein